MSYTIFEVDISLDLSSSRSSSCLLEEETDQVEQSYDFRLQLTQCTVRYRAHPLHSCKLTVTREVCASRLGFSGDREVAEKRALGDRTE